MARAMRGEIKNGRSQAGGEGFYEMGEAKREERVVISEAWQQRQCCQCQSGWLANRGARGSQVGTTQVGGRGRRKRKRGKENVELGFLSQNDITQNHTLDVK